MYSPVQIYSTSISLLNLPKNGDKRLSSLEKLTYPLLPIITLIPKPISTKGISILTSSPKVMATPVMAKITVVITKANIRAIIEVKHPNIIAISL